MLLILMVLQINQKLLSLILSQDDISRMFFRQLDEGVRGHDPEVLIHEVQSCIVLGFEGLIVWSDG